VIGMIAVGYPLSAIGKTDWPTVESRPPIARNMVQIQSNHRKYFLSEDNMNTEQQAKQWGQIVTKASQDVKFRNRLLADPATVVKESGLEVPAGVQLRVLENSDYVLHLVLPPLQTEKELSDAELEGVAGGLVVNAIIAVLIGLLVPADPKGGNVSGASARASGSIRK
jgi:hypothetical protein